jgi:DNA helicase-2/ATP-dependent DNA helicase PcrA
MKSLSSVEIPDSRLPDSARKGPAAEKVFLEALNRREMSFANVIIDEGQDFSDSWIEGLRKCTKGRFFVFYDRNQALFQSKLPSWFEKAECRLVLKRICRNTREIATTAFRIVDSSARHYDAPSGPKPVLHLHSSRLQSQRILQRILTSYISKNGVEPKDIAVLTVKTQGVSEVASFNWPVKFSDDIYLNAVCFTSAARFKGMERRIVIVVDMDFGLIGDSKIRQKLHLGCSRAVHELHIIACRPSLEVVRATIEVLGGRTVPAPTLQDLGDLLSVDLGK